MHWKGLECTRKELECTRKELECTRKDFECTRNDFECTGSVIGWRRMAMLSLIKYGVAYKHTFAC